MSQAPPCTVNADSLRAADVWAGVRLEIVTVLWMVVEAAVSLGAGLVAGSILLTAFGLDSVIELISGSVLLWRLSAEAGGGDVERVERVERAVTWIVALTLALLCIYILVSSLYSLAAQSKPEKSPLGIGVALAALLIMPWLGMRKRRIAERIDSAALRGDAAESFTCAYMAGTVLAGLVLDALLGWWWAEAVAALLFLVWLGRETLESFGKTREAGA